MRRQPIRQTHRGKDGRYTYTVRQKGQSKTLKSRKGENKAQFTKRCLDLDQKAAEIPDKQEAVVDEVSDDVGAGLVPVIGKAPEDLTFGVLFALWQDHI